MKMPRFARLAFAVALLSLNIGSVPLTSAAQTGGVPSLADQVQTLQNQVQILQTQNQTLTTTITNLQTIVVTLQTTNTGLQSALNAETAARIAAINALQAALSAETTNRITGDGGLGLQLQILTSNEAFDVTQIYTTTNHLQSELDALNNSPVGDVWSAVGGLSPNLTNNSATDVVSLALPAGSYLIHAMLPLYNTDGDVQTERCALSTDPQGLVGLESGSNADVELQGYDSTNMPLLGTISLATATTVSVRCMGYGLVVSQPTMAAVPILYIK